MTRIRLVLLAVALGLGVPVAVLAWRALDGLALERAVRHQALAERAFDEMERALSGWLAAEEARPVEHYRFYASPGGERSPLSRPTEPFVVGAFQIDPDGTIHTPRRPRDENQARARGDWPADAPADDAIARVTAVARDVWQQALPEDDAPAPQLDPGTTRQLSGPSAGKLEKEAKKDQALALEEEEGVSVYGALQRLNRGADLRAERKQKVTALPEAYAASEAAPARPREAGGRESFDDADAYADAAGAADDSLAQAPSLDALEPRQLRALGYAVAPAPSAPAAKRAPRRVTVDPLVGRPAGDDLLLLVRTVLVGEQGYRQGLVLDRAALADWLSARALDPSGLSRVATLRFGEDPIPARGDEDFVFQHRFAEPFDAITAQLSLATLPGLAGPGPIYGLVALLAVVGAVGLFAVHRMVAVAVHFAERRNNFVSAVTHELKTPLTAIRMYGEMLRDGLVPSEAKKSEYYGTITDESERLSRLIDNVLEFSRLERGTREMSFVVGPLPPVVEEAVEKLRAHAASQGFTLEVEVAPDLPPVRYDRDALLQVIFNLVDNAMKYAGATQRRVVVEARPAPGGAELSVRDFGPGVPGRHLARIFEPFYRGEDELTRSTKGTGIGLALVRDLAERMGARVRGANAPGGGFRVALEFEARAAG
ncbi:MAG: sensor histidine kinase [Myxococcota bacterium]